MYDTADDFRTPKLARNSKDPIDNGVTNLTQLLFGREDPLGAWQQAWDNEHRGSLVFQVLRDWCKGISLCSMEGIINTLVHKLCIPGIDHCDIFPNIFSVVNVRMPILISLSRSF